MAATRPAAAPGPAQAGRTDRRQLRHQATKREILTRAWRMVRTDGLAALSLSALARAVGMEPQSLYTYFASKHAVYDAMYAEANRELLARMQAVTWDGSALELLRAQARVIVMFSAEDQARHQLVFERAIPDFKPSPESYAIAVEVVTTARAQQAQAGLTGDAQFDLWTAVVAGLAAQQSANDPGGDRWIRLIDQAVDMYARHVFPTRPQPEHGAV
jgi:AcrR family transcriptional regulator